MSYKAECNEFSLTTTVLFFYMYLKLLHSQMLIWTIYSPLFQ